MTKMRWLARTALLAALLTVAGTLKLPSLAPGAEFQFSAPLAVAMCAVFGFKQYILAGLLSSVMGLLLGTQTLLNVTVALVFRMVAGGIVALGGQSWPILAIAGPLGSIMARLVLGAIIGQAALPLVLTAVPGMVFTAVMVKPLVVGLRRIKLNTERRMTHAVQR